MSLYSVADTGKVPPPPSSENEFQNVNLPLENSPSENDETEAAIGEGETVATEESSNLATAEPLTSPAVSLSKSGKPLSAAQANVQRLRSETLADMREKYAERFGNTTLYPKPPKAKAYHASGLTSIRQRDGEAAYEVALKDIMDKNDPRMGENGMSQRAMTQKFKKKAANSVTFKNTAAPRNNTAAPRNNASNNTSTSIEEMGRSAKSLIDSIIKSAKAMSRAPSAKPIAPLFNVSKTFKPKRVRSRPTKKAAPLFTVPEENAANSAMNSGMNSATNTATNTATNATA